MMPSERADIVRAQLHTEDGAVVAFEHEAGDGVEAEQQRVLHGDEHPALPFVDDVRVVLDIGAGWGATTVLFARRHPDARIHALEWDSNARVLLTRNVGTLANVDVHAVGADAVLGAWTAGETVERVDIVRVVADGREAEVLAGLAPHLAAVKVLYLDYSSRDARRAQATKLSDTHDLYRSIAFLDHGRSIYLRRDLAEDPAASARLLELFLASFEAARVSEDRPRPGTS